MSIVHSFISHFVYLLRDLVIAISINTFHIPSYLIRIITFTLVSHRAFPFLISQVVLLICSLYFPLNISSYFLHSARFYLSDKQMTIMHVEINFLSIHTIRLILHKPGQARKDIRNKVVVMDDGDDHRFPPLQRFVWHQQIPMLESTGSSKQVSL